MMLQKRRDAIIDPVSDSKSSVVTLSRDYRAGRTIPMHFHDRDQLVYASRGVMTVHTGNEVWVVPTHRAVWIPLGIPHKITMSGDVAMRTLYFEARLVHNLPQECCVVNVTPLLRELILHACVMGALKKTNQKHLNVVRLVIDQLRGIELVPLRLRHPSDVRAGRVAQALLANPSDQRPLMKVCRSVGTSKRTIERLFLNELGMTLGKWRQQLRLMHAMHFLAEGAKVTHAALEAGYSTPSAFISMFRKTLGTTPTAYFRASSGR
ncbi:MAG: helix-turn-helix transcriptional regulator [Terriglobales bacterium]|jgi:AraC-like DNA-binding protein/quercetin dioxygenase-like cupin family protein